MPKDTSARSDAFAQARTLARRLEAFSPTAEREAQNKACFEIHERFEAKRRKLTRITR